jgi:hypothetical protein
MMCGVGQRAGIAAVRSSPSTLIAMTSAPALLIRSLRDASFTS